MRASILKISILILAVAVTASGQSLKPTTARVAPMSSEYAAAADLYGSKAQATITRDARGVWFVEGETVYDIYEGMGYAVATDRLFQMDLFRRQARGTMSELLGASFLGEDFLSGDVLIRTIQYSDDEFEQMFNDLSEDAQAAVQGYVDGINRRIGEFYAGNWRAMPFEYWLASFLSVFQLGGGSILPTPFTVNDILGWMAVLQRNFDPEALEQTQLDNIVLLQTWLAVYPTDALAMFSDQRWINDPSAQTMIPAPAAAKAMVHEPQLPTVDVTDYPDLRDAAQRIRDRVESHERAMEKLNVRVKMGSYAWAVSGDKTASGNPIVYSGPQMGFMFPAIVVEGAIKGAGFDISGMTVPGVPGIIIGRTPHHAWSMQVGHAHTQDWYIDPPQAAFLHRMETIYPAGGDPVTFPVFRTSHGPIVDPLPFNPNDPPAQVVSWAYAHWGREAKTIEAFQQAALAESMADFDAAIEQIAVSQHFTYADRDGNIAYWMSGWDPVRAPGVDPRLPSLGNGLTEWTGERRPRVHDSNPDQGFYGGWNNKASVDYNNATGTYSYYFGPAHRAHVIKDYLSSHDNLTYDEVRDLALFIATTDSFGGGGNTWSFVADDFKAAVAANSSPKREAAIDVLDAWDGHFVAGGPAEWRFGALRADAWVLQDAWIKEVMRLTFGDEFAMSGFDVDDQPDHILFNVLLRALAGPEAALPTFYNWFQDVSGSGIPTTADGIIVLALDNVLAEIGDGPYNAPRGMITYGHPLLGAVDPAFGAIHSTPFSSRSTYAHCVEFDATGPVKIQSMFPLGESGALYFNGTLTPDFDTHAFSMVPVYDPFTPRDFPLFE